MPEISCLYFSNLEKPNLANNFERLYNYAGVHTLHYFQLNILKHLPRKETYYLLASTYRRQEFLASWASLAPDILSTSRLARERLLVGWLATIPRPFKFVVWRN